MNRIRLSQQEADPIGGITAAWIVTIGAALALGTAVVQTVAHWREVVSPVAAIIALGLVAVAGIVAAVSATPQRAPFTTERLWLVVGLAVAAAVAEYVSTIGANRMLYDDFGSIVIGMLILALAPYCTWLSLLAAGLLSAAVLSFLVVGSAMATAVDVPIASLIAVNSAAVLSLSAAAAGYSYAIVDETLAWQRKANRAALQRDAELRAGIARSVQQSQVSVLGREVLPFLAGVMPADRISVDDADHARELAETLRHALKAGIESTWLDDLAANLQLTRAIDVVVDDPSGAADDLASDQRSALTALLSWLSDSGRTTAIEVVLAIDPPRHRITIRAVNGAAPPTRRELDRFAAVARAVALRAEVALTGENVKVEVTHVPD
ncbi:hypothetical protein [Agromyces sp. Marseille-P2726]|uniref:hypothetical protein n=1 Tax=Agromyces sp. Marseille-P2726 TaxID=2709132 RepID=UPI001570FA62|nr:hypothetical protein [Agromyces sp. Marseille-P2726]